MCVVGVVVAFSFAIFFSLTLSTFCNRGHRRGMLVSRKHPSPATFGCDPGSTSTLLM